MGGAIGKSGTVGFLGDEGECEIVVFEPDMCGPIEPEFNEDVVLWSNAEGLIGQQLKETVLAAQGKIVGDDAGRAQGEDFL